MRNAIMRIVLAAFLMMCSSFWMEAPATRSEWTVEMMRSGGIAGKLNRVIVTSNGRIEIWENGTLRAQESASVDMIRAMDDLLARHQPMQELPPTDMRCCHQILTTTTVTNNGKTSLVGARWSSDADQPTTLGQEDYRSLQAMITPLIERASRR
jgi:hypothetical protein